MPIHKGRDATLLFVHRVEDRIDGRPWKPSEEAAQSGTKHASNGAITADPAYDFVEVTEPIEQAKLAGARPNEPAAIEERRFIANKAIPAPAPNPILETVVRFVEHYFQKLDILGAFGLEGVQPYFVCAGRIGACLDPQALNQADDPEASPHDADGSDGAHWGREDLVSRAGQPIAAGSADILYYG